MKISFDNPYAGFLIALVIFVAAGISYFLYFRNESNSSLSKTQKGILFLLRFFSLGLILLFLMSPLIKRIKTIKQLPIFAIAFDNSQSVQQYGEDFKKFFQAAKDRLSNKFELEFWAFGDKVENTETFTGKNKSSDYGQIIKSLKSNYFNKNIGGVVLLGDGIFNQGMNPQNSATSLKFPVFTVGVGDTTKTRDAIIRNVKTNKIAFLKNKFPVEIELKFSKLTNQMAFLDIENNGKQVYSGSIAISSDDDFKLQFLNLEASEPGLQHFKIKIRPFEGEINLKNNDYEFVIRVLENKQKILIVAEGPHPDLGAIKNSLDELQNYETKLITGNEMPDSLSKYSLIILNQFPSQRNSASKLLTKIKESRLPVLFIVGPNTLLDQLNALDFGITISNSKNTEEVQAIFNPDFSLFVLPQEIKQALEMAPPLIAPFGNTAITSQIQNLAFQNIRNIHTNKTLMAFGNDKGRKSGFILGEGIWRWRLFDYMENHNHDAFNELIQKMVQYLAIHENEDNFNVYYPAIFQENDNIELTAELYNDSYELLNTPDVSIKIVNDSLKEYIYQFDRINDYYHLNAGNLNPGDYSFEAETSLGNQHFVEKGNFSILKNEIEIQNKQADFEVLVQIAQQTGGQFYSIENYGTLLDVINDDKMFNIKEYSQTTETEWINLKSLFFILLVLLGAEWFFRKYWGTY